MTPREYVKLVATIVVMVAVLAVSAAARGSLDPVDAPASAEASYELSANC